MAMFPKGETRRQQKARRDREEAAWIAAVRAELFARFDRCCDCGETQAETDQRFARNGWAAPSEHHMDEERSRAKTRGMHYIDRFNLAVCRRRCPTCHMKRHGLTVARDRRPESEITYENE